MTTYHRPIAIWILFLSLFNSFIQSTHSDVRASRHYPHKCAALLTLRGGHEFATISDDPNAWHEGVTCEEFEQIASLRRNVPKGSEHAPWVDVRRQAHIEMKVHNRSQMLELQNSGQPPPRVPLLYFGKKGSRQPLCETWEQYWQQWVSHTCIFAFSICMFKHARACMHKSVCMFKHACACMYKSACACWHA